MEMKRNVVYQGEDECGICNLKGNATYGSDIVHVVEGKRGIWRQRGMWYMEVKGNLGYGGKGECGLWR